MRIRKVAELGGIGGKIEEGFPAKSFGTQDPRLGALGMTALQCTCRAEARRYP